jgi:hypothetical protein
LKETGSYLGITWKIEMHLPLDALDAGMAEQGGHLGGHGHAVSDVVGKVNMRALECTTFRIAILKTTLLHVLKECKQLVGPRAVQ